MKIWDTFRRFSGNAKKRRGRPSGSENKRSEVMGSLRGRDLRMEQFEERMLLSISTTSVENLFEDARIIRNDTFLTPNSELLKTNLELNGQGLQFNLIPADGMPQQAIDGFQAAADVFSSMFYDDIIVNIDIDFRTLGEGILGQAGSTRKVNTYSQTYTALEEDAISVYDTTSVANLPEGPDFDIFINRTSDNPNGSGSAVPYVDGDGDANNTTIYLTTANAKALGLLAAGNAESDANITFSDAFNWDFDRSDGIDAGAYDFVGVAIHEIGHALGFTSGVDMLDQNSPPVNGPFQDDEFVFVNPLDLYRFSSESIVAGADIDWTADARTKYFFG